MVMESSIYDFSAAAREGNLDVLRQCLKRDANKRDADGMTPVHWAALYGNLEALKVLLTTGGGDPDKPNNEGSTAVHLAATNGQLHCLIFLTNVGGNVHAINDVGDTPMNEASNKRRLECVRHLEAIVTHQVSQDRQKVEKMQQRAKRDAEKRVKQKTKYLQKLDRDFEKKSAKQRKYLGAPMSTHANLYGSMNGDEMNSSSRKLTFSQLAGMPHSNGGMSHVFDNEDEENLDDESISADSFRRAEEEFLTRTSLLSDDIVFERTDKQSSVGTEQTDLSNYSSDFPTKSAMMASLNSLHSKGQATRMNGRSPYDKMRYHNSHGSNNGSQHFNGKMHGGGGGDARRLSSDTSKSNNITNNTRFAKVAKGFGRAQHLGQSLPSQNRTPATNVPPSKRTGRPVGYVEVHMGPLYTFLHSLQLDEFREVFLREKIDLGACLLCDDNDLREIGLPLGSRKKLLAGIRKRNEIIANSNKSDFCDSSV